MAQEMGPKLGPRALLQRSLPAPQAVLRGSGPRESDLGAFVRAAKRRLHLPERSRQSRGPDRLARADGTGPPGRPPSGGRGQSRDHPKGAGRGPVHRPGPDPDPVEPRAGCRSGRAKDLSLEPSPEPRLPCTSPGASGAAPGRVRASSERARAGSGVERAGSGGFGRRASGLGRIRASSERARADSGVERAGSGGFGRRASGLGRVRASSERARVHSGDDLRTTNGPQPKARRALPSPTGGPMPDWARSTMFEVMPQRATVPFYLGWGIPSGFSSSS